MVYIAGSLKGSIIKIGYTKDVQIREESLNRTEYAGYYDWIVLFAIRSINAGEIESRLDMALKEYSFLLTIYMMEDFKKQMRFLNVVI